MTAFACPADFEHEEDWSLTSTSGTSSGLVGQPYFMTAFPYKATTPFRVAYPFISQDPTTNVSIQTFGVQHTFGIQEWVKRVVFKVIALTKLKENWDASGSPPPSMHMLNSIIDALTATNVELSNDPYIVPTAGGGIQLEWVVGNKELEIEFIPSGKIGVLALEEIKERDESVTFDTTDIGQLRFWLEWIQS